MRETGEPWLGAIPAHWGTSRTKSLFEIKKRIAGELGHDVLSVTQQGLRVRDVSSNDGQLSMDYSKYQIVEVGDFVMNHMDLLTGFVDVASMPGVTSPDYRVFVARQVDLDLRYFLYLFQNGYRQKIFYAFGQGASEFGRWRMPTDNFNGFILPVPPANEQTAISAFLDRETDRIDMLVEEQRRLIELLKEKRQAVISHAVTKGLDPNAKMKHSGAEWVGDVPAHWIVAKIKRGCLTITDGAHVSPETEGGEYPFISTKDVDGGTIDFTGCLLTSEASYTSLVRSGCQPLLGDVLFSKDGTIGETAVVRDRRSFVVASSLIIIRPDAEKLDPDYLGYLCRSSMVMAQVESLVKGAGLPRLSIQNLLKVIGVLPPVGEQLDIVRFLETTVGHFDTLVLEAGAAIALLQERRSALISAAVTGKIDVRDFQPTKEEVAA